MKPRLPERLVLLRWGLPSATLLLVPKCPLCATLCGVAATWYGMSLELANTLRIALLAMSGLMLGWLVIARIRSILRSHKLVTHLRWRELA